MRLTIPQPESVGCDTQKSTNSPDHLEQSGVCGADIVEGYQCGFTNHAMAKTQNQLEPPKMKLLLRSSSFHDSLLNIPSYRRTQSEWKQSADKSPSSHYNVTSGQIFICPESRHRRLGKTVLPNHPLIKISFTFIITACLPSLCVTTGLELIPPLSQAHHRFHCPRRRLCRCRCHSHHSRRRRRRRRRREKLLTGNG